MRLLSIAIAVLALAGCQSNPTESSRPKLEASLGQQVTLVGIAESRKGGAVLQGKDFHVWLKEMSAWPDDVVDKKVEVKGRLEEDHGLPVFIPKPGEPVVQGVPVPEGTDLKEAARRLVVVKPTWRLLE